MALILNTSILFLVSVLMELGVCGMQPDQGGNDDPQDALPRYPLRPKRWPVNPWQRAVVPQEQSHLQPGMDYWMKYPPVLGNRNPELMEESNRNPNNPTFSGGLHRVGPFGNPYDHVGLVVEGNEQPRGEIPLHPSSLFTNLYNKEDSLTNPYEITRDERILHSLWRPENYNDHKEILMDHHDHPGEGKFSVNPNTFRQTGYYQRPGTAEVAKHDKNLGNPQPASTDKLIRTLPDRWNEFVINSIVKLTYGGDDVFDMSEFSWIPGQETLSPSMIENMLRWNQPDGSGSLVPKLLKGIDSSVTWLDDQGKWKFPFNSLQIYTVPLSIVRLFHDSVKPTHVQTQSKLQDTKEAVRYDLEKSRESPGEVRGLHLPNRHAVDFRDYHDFDLVPSKEFPQKDPVLLGQEGA